MRIVLWREEEEDDDDDELHDWKKALAQQQRWGAGRAIGRVPEEGVVDRTLISSATTA